MAITTADIAAVLNARLKRAETPTTLAEPIRGALADLSARAKWPDLYAVNYVLLLTGECTVAIPSSFGVRVLDGMMIRNPGTDGFPAMEYNPFEDLIVKTTGVSSTIVARPLEWSRRANDLFFDCYSDDDYAVWVAYWRWHPAAGAILFSDPFREAIYNAVMMKYLEGLGLASDPKFAEKSALYDRAVSLLLHTAESKPVTVKYTDLG
jgi:hypothetical protein